MPCRASHFHVYSRYVFVFCMHCCRLGLIVWSWVKAWLFDCWIIRMCKASIVFLGLLHNKQRAFQPCQQHALAMRCHLHVVSPFTCLLWFNSSRENSSREPCVGHGMQYTPTTTAPYCCPSLCWKLDVNHDILKQRHRLMDSVSEIICCEVCFSWRINDFLCSYYYIYLVYCRRRPV